MTIRPLVNSHDPITLLGGSSLDQIDLNKSLMIAPKVVAADGGSNRLVAMGIAPEAVIGDFDSLNEDARARFADRLHHVSEQDTTDFEKVLQRTEAPLFLAAGFMGGRLDHSFSTLNVIARYEDKRVIVFGGRDLIMRVVGRLTLTLPVGTPLALLPMGLARATTSGLQWDMADVMLAPDGLVSSSNKTAKPQVTIDAVGPLLICLPKPTVDAVITAVRV